ncbi:glycosyltransferase family 39 protein [Novosphingobium sp. KCTC 2891]|uniref:glycosyltransferase family 39 protein n=1 Tax=Novosphingobium sp. KCTC 2891 TaxID=2989730 RepID=UPI0022223B86|nr:glycosyltransferase family 39 protein [Novosphingobium sp. KCTC 2891]
MLRPQALPLAFALLVGLRALAILLDVTPTSDADFYYSRAVSLALGHGYLANDGHATAYWPPGWPMALSVAFRALGASTIVVGLLNLAGAALSGWLLLDLGRKVTGSEPAARAALLAYAVYPNAVLYVPLALTEVFYTALLLGGCWLMVARSGWGWTVLAGVVFGLATLVKAQTLVVVPLVLAIALLRQPAPLRRIPGLAAQGFAVLAVAALTVAPWTIRNHRELGAWVAVSTNGGITLLTGNNDSARGTFTPDDPAVKALDARRDLDELAYDAEARRLGTAWIREHPARFAALMPRKLLRLWGPDGEGVWAYETGARHYHAGAFLMLRLANQAFYVAVLALAALAVPLTLAARRRAGLNPIDWWLLPYGIALYPSAIAMVFSGQSRFHFPAMPFLCMAAAAGLVALLGRRQATLAQTSSNASK